MNLLDITPPVTNVEFQHTVDRVVDDGAGNLIIDIFPSYITASLGVTDISFDVQSNSAMNPGDVHLVQIEATCQPVGAPPPIPPEDKLIG